MPSMQSAMHKCWETGVMIDDGVRRGARRGAGRIRSQLSMFGRTAMLIVLFFSLHLVPYKNREKSQPLLDLQFPLDPESTGKQARRPLPGVRAGRALNEWGGRGQETAWRSGWVQWTARVSAWVRALGGAC